MQCDCLLGACCRGVAGIASRAMVRTTLELLARAPVVADGEPTDRLARRVVLFDADTADGGALHEPLSSVDARACGSAEPPPANSRTPAGDTARSELEQPPIDHDRSHRECCKPIAGAREAEASRRT